MQTEWIAAIKASWMIGAQQQQQQQQHHIVWNASPRSSFPIYTHRLATHGPLPALTVLSGKTPAFFLLLFKYSIPAWADADYYTLRKADILILKRCCVERRKGLLLGLNLEGLHITIADVLSRLLLCLIFKATSEFNSFIYFQPDLGVLSVRSWHISSNTVIQCESQCHHTCHLNCLGLVLLM